MTTEPSMQMRTKRRAWAVCAQAQQALLLRQVHDALIARSPDHLEKVQQLPAAVARAVETPVDDRAVAVRPVRTRPEEQIAAVKVAVDCCLLRVHVASPPAPAAHVRPDSNKPSV